MSDIWTTQIINEYFKSIKERNGGRDQGKEGEKRGSGRVRGENRERLSYCVPFTTIKTKSNEHMK